jgi:hypothetical protein
VYASLLGISGALHLGVFDQPAKQVSSMDLEVLSSLYSVKTGKSHELGAKNGT